MQLSVELPSTAPSSMASSSAVPTYETRSSLRSEGLRKPLLTPRLTSPARRWIKRLVTTFDRDTAIGVFSEEGRRRTNEPGVRVGEALARSRSPGYRWYRQDAPPT